MDVTSNHSEAVVWPAQAAAMQVATDSIIYVADRRNWCEASRSKFSLENVEKVMRPPRNPVASRARVAGDMEL